MLEENVIINVVKSISEKFKKQPYLNSNGNCELFSFCAAAKKYLDFYHKLPCGILDTDSGANPSCIVSGIYKGGKTYVVKQPKDINKHMYPNIGIEKGTGNCKKFFKQIKNLLKIQDIHIKRNLGPVFSVSFIDDTMMFLWLVYIDEYPNGINIYLK